MRLLVTGSTGFLGTAGASVATTTIPWRFSFAPPANCGVSPTFWQKLAVIEGDLAPCGGAVRGSRLRPSR